MEQRAFDEQLDFVSVEKVVVVFIVFLENEGNCFLNLISAIAQFMVFTVSFVLHEPTVKSFEGALMFAKGGI
jgi:hypothetical protein